MYTPTGCKLIVQKGPQSGQQFDLSKEINVVGRDSSADITINDGVISRHHFRIMASGGQFILEDLNSSNGTYLNGMQVFGKTALNPGDVISISPEITFEFRAPQPVSGPTQMASQAVPMGGPARGAAQPKLVVTIEGRASQTYPLLKPQITIGRSEDNDITIPSQVMSRYHARLERVGAEYAFVPLPNATNPFWLQGTPATTRFQLNHLNELRINSDQPNTAVTLVYEAAVPSAAPAQAARPGVQPAVQHSPGGTMLDVDFDDIGPSTLTPPELVVTIAGQPAQIHRLGKPRLSIGRAPENDIIIPSEIVSRYHGHLEFRDRRYEFIADPRATNALLFEDLQCVHNPCVHNLSFSSCSWIKTFLNELREEVTLVQKDLIQER